MVPDAVRMEELWSQQECSIIFQFKASLHISPKPSIPEHITHPKYSQTYKHMQLNEKYHVPQGHFKAICLYMA